MLVTNSPDRALSGATCYMIAKKRENVGCFKKIIYICTIIYLDC